MADSQVFKLPKQPKEPPLYRLDPFRGIDLSVTKSQIDKNHSPDMLNFNIDERGALNKRTGYEAVYDLSTYPIQGIHYYRKKDGTEVFLVVWQYDIYEFPGEDFSVAGNQLTNNLTLSTIAPMSFFEMNDKCYFLNGKDFLVYDGTTLSEITPYIPTLTIARPPSGGGTKNEDFNLLGAGFIDSFSPDGTSTVYQLSLTSLDSSTVTASIDGGVTWNKYEGTDFSVDRATGKVTWTTAPPDNGPDSVKIKAYKTYSDKPLMIKKCTFNIEFGGNNDTRVFVSGNPDYPNQMWRSGLYDPTYWPENGFYKVGSDREYIQGFSKQYDYLVIHKETSFWNMHFELDTNGNISFPIKPLNSEHGAHARKSIQTINNSPVSLDKNGVYIMTSTNIRDERNIKHISSRVDNKLLVEPNLDKALSVDFENKYWISVNGNAYIYDYYYDEWFIYDNINATCFLVVKDNLYFGTSDGKLCRFKKKTDTLPYNDNGSPINAYWYSKLIDFEAPEMLKLVKHIYLSMKTNDHTSVNLYLRTDKKGERLISSKRLDKINFLSFDFTKFGFITSDIPQELTKKVKEKKITHIQLKIENNELDESLGITSLGILYDFQRAVK